MRRAERLFRIIQVLKQADRAVTAREIGAALEVSPRTIYRDIAHLVGSGVPVDGEAGVGYILRDAYELPPLTFTYEQIEALAFGAQAAGLLGDADLARSARDALAKIEAVLPEEHADRLRTPWMFAMRPSWAAAPPALLGELRAAIRKREKLAAVYDSLNGDTTTRILRPLGLVNFGPVWLLAAWCELRGDFRNFRVDRLLGAKRTGDAFADEAGKTLEDYLALKKCD